MNILRVGTDCSGIEAPIQALIQMDIPFKHVFSSDIDKFCIKSIKANYETEIIFGDKDGIFPEGDITKRNIKDVPDIDLYICGFPCQPFSLAGLRQGFYDKRGNVFFSCMDVIIQKQPKYFILENVKGILNHDKGNTWNIILSELEKLKKYKYNIEWRILNTKDYKIPQSRSRVYIVGIKEQKIIWPENIANLDKLEDYIDQEDNYIYDIPNFAKELLKKVPKNSIFINLGFTKTNFPNSDKMCPAILASNKIWCVPKSRYINVKELLKLQGFNSEFKQVVSKTQLKKQIGNSMSVNVLKCLFEKILLP